MESIEQTRGCSSFLRSLSTPVRSATRQVVGVDDLFNEKLRIVVEYMQFREFPADLKRKVPARGRGPMRGCLLLAGV